MLRPFQSRFAKLIERIQKHRIWFETEAKINEHGLVLGFYKDFKTFLKQSEDNVDPRNPLEDGQGSKLRFTCRLLTKKQRHKYEESRNGYKARTIPQLMNI